MDAWYRHFEKDCSHSLAIDYEFSRKERVLRGAFDMRSFFTKPGTKQEAMACPTSRSWQDLVVQHLCGCYLSRAPGRWSRASSTSWSSTQASAPVRTTAPATPRRHAQCRRLRGTRWWWWTKHGWTHAALCSVTPWRHPPPRAPRLGSAPSQRTAPHHPTPRAATTASPANVQSAVLRLTTRAGQSAAEADGEGWQSPRGQA